MGVYSFSLLSVRLLVCMLVCVCLFVCLLAVCCYFVDVFVSRRIGLFAWLCDCEFVGLCGCVSVCACLVACLLDCSRVVFVCLFVCL